MLLAALCGLALLDDLALFTNPDVDQGLDISVVTKRHN
jgi:hypothetical protein